MSKVIEALRREHESIESVLGVLDSEIAYLAESAGRRRADYRLVWSAIDYFTDFPALVHHPKEDVVYERLRQADPAAALRAGDIPGAHVTLAAELNALGAELKAVMENGRRPRAELVALARAFVEHQRRHLEAEESKFFPIAERALDAKAWAELEYRTMARLDPLIGGPSGERFESLRRSVVTGSTVKPPLAKG